MVQFTLNLPHMTRDADFAEATRAGAWMPAAGTLGQLSHSIDVAGFDDEEEPIRAIPDPWAQPRTFADALIAEHHSMKTLFVGQWRGLLALIGLRDFYADRYSLTLEQVEFGDQFVFDKILSQLAPGHALAGRTDLWQRPVLVRFHKGPVHSVPVALINPACLVSAGRQVRSELFDNIPWMRPGLSDPLALAEELSLPKPALAALVAYLRGLVEAVQLLPDPDPRQTGWRQSIIYLLETYAQETAARVRGPAPHAEFIARPADALDPVLAPVWGYGRLEQPAEPWLQSEGLLRLRQQDGGRALDFGSLKGIILADAALARQAGRQAQDVAIWGLTTLGDVLGSEETFQRIKAAARDQGYLLVRAGDLFTDRATRILAGNMAQHPAKLTDALLPVRPLVLLLDGDFNAKLAADADGGALNVRLAVQRAAGRSGERVEIKRTFSGDAKVRGPRLLPDHIATLSNAVVWPDFRSIKWRHYVARFSYNKAYAQQAKPVAALSAAILAAAIGEAGSGRAAVERLDAVNQGLLPASDESWFGTFTSTLADQDEFDQVQSSNRGFEAIFYVARSQTGSDEAIGCAALAVDATDPVEENQAVAVDFGTTSTVACFEDMAPIRLEDRLVHPIDLKSGQSLSNRLLEKRWIFQEFLPAFGQQMPAPSVALLRPGTDEQRVDPLIRHVAFFNNEPGANGAVAGKSEQDPDAMLGKYRDLMPRTRFNLKWDNEQAVLRASADYLRQLILMIAAEAVAHGFNPCSLSWRFSVPDAMDEATRKRFEQNIDPIIATVSPDGPAGGRHELYSEGFVAARYMLSGARGADLPKGSINVVLDIGGGTTDISIWVRNRLKWKGSFKDLAGKAFFTQTLINNPALLESLGLKETVTMMTLAEPGAIEPKGKGRGRTDRSKYRVSQRYRTDFAELLFSGPRLEQALSVPEVWSQNIEADVGAALRATALAFISGIAFYVGLVARAMIAQGVIDAEDLANPAFALCGRGSGIFRKLHGVRRRAHESSPVTRALRAFTHAAGVDPAERPMLLTSDATKLEVVRGMVVDYPSMRDGEPESTVLPAGVALRFGDDAVLPSDLDAREATSDRELLDVDLGGFRAFLDFLEKEQLLRLDLAPADEEADGRTGDTAADRIADDVRDRVDEQRDKHRRVALSEPPFISALRALIHILSSSAGARDGKIKVHVP